MKTLPRTLWEVLKFEAVCKLLAICLVYPVLNGVFQIYAASEGLNFNAGVVSAFLSPPGLAGLGGGGRLPCLGVCRHPHRPALAAQPAGSGGL